MHKMNTSDGHKHVENPQRERWVAIGAAYRGILDTVPAAAYVCDGSGQITYFNPIAEAVWGRTPRLHDAGELYCGSHRLYSADGVQMRHEECWMALALQQGIPYHGHAVVIERQDGTRTIGKSHAHPLLDNKGRIVGALNLVADITKLSGTEPYHSKPDLASRAYVVTMAIIEITASVLTAMRWEKSAFE